MIKKTYQRNQSVIAGLAMLAIVLMPISVFTQTKIKYHSNKYSVQDDVKLGRQAAAEAEQQFPLLRDSEVEGYVENVGRRLSLKHPGRISASRVSVFLQSNKRARHQRFCFTGWADVRQSRHD